MSDPSSHCQATSNELGWPVLSLPGPRPPAWGPDPAGLGSASCLRLMAVRAMEAVAGLPGASVEVDGPWAIPAREVWSDLGYGDALASLDSRYTRWLDERMALRSQTSSAGSSRRARHGARGARRKPATLTPATVSKSTSIGGGSALETLECGLADPELLARCGLAGWGGLALGMGLDRMCMLAKGLPDARLLDDQDPKARAQMVDLAPWRPWSRQPGCARDISVAVPIDWVAEQVVGAAAEALSRPEWLEAVEVVGRWEGAGIPERAAQKLGSGPEHANWLLRLRLRDWEGSIPKSLADEQARRAWDALHRGASTTYRPGV